MKKLLILLMVLVASTAWGADVMITDLSEQTEWTMDDLLIIVDSPSSGASAKKMTMATLMDYKIDAADGKYYGPTITMTVDASAPNTSFGQCMYVASDGELSSADADASTTAPCVCLLITTGTGASKKCMIQGTITLSAWNWTAGGILYLSTDPSTDRGLTQTAPSGAGDQIQPLGVALNLNTILFLPSMSTAEHQ